MSVKLRKPSFAAKTLGKARRQPAKAIRKKKKQTARDGYLMWYIRFIRENNKKLTLEKEIEQQRQENLNVANDYAEYRQTHACYLKRNVELAQ